MNKFDVLISEKEIDKKVCELAQIINDKYKNSNEVLMVCVLSGAFMFFSDLVKKINLPVKLEFIKVKSYENTASTGKVNEILFNLPDLKDKDIIIIEDIVDTGITAKYLVNRIKKDFNPKSLSFVSLFNKRSRRQVDFQPDLSGFEIDDKFIVGYGLDCDGNYRNLPYIAVINNG